MVAKKGMLKGLKNIKFSNRLSFTILSVVAVLLLATVVYADITPGVAPNPGHTVLQVAPPSTCTDGQFLKWNYNQGSVFRHFYYRQEYAGGKDYEA